MTGTTATAPETAKYTSKSRLYKIEEGGEVHILAAEHVSDVLREHYQPGGNELEEGESVEVTLLDAGDEVRVRWDGEPIEGDVPAGGRVDEGVEGKNPPIVIATAAQWAVHADATTAKWCAEKFDGDYKPTAVIISSTLF